MKNACEKHESNCRFNPENKRACHGCRNLITTQAFVINEYSSGGEERKVNILYCPILDSYMHPPKVEHKGNAFELTDEKINIPFLKSCEHRSGYDELFKVIYQLTND